MFTADVQETEFYLFYKNSIQSIFYLLQKIVDYVKQKWNDVFLANTALFYFIGGQFDVIRRNSTGITHV